MYEKKNNEIKINLIESGLKLFSERGYHGTGIKEIVNSQGVPKGSFYNYFESKEDFIAEIVKHYEGILEKLWESSVEDGPDNDPLLMLKKTLRQFQKKLLQRKKTWQTNRYF